VKQYLPIKKLFQCLFFCALISTHLVTYVRAQDSIDARRNIVRNGDFSSVVAPTYPANWKHTKSIVGKATYVVRGGENTHSGGNALYINIQRNPIQGAHAVYQDKLRLKAETTYRLTFKARSILQHSSISMKVHDNSTKSSLLASDAIFTTTQNMQEFETVFTTPPVSTHIDATLLLQFKSEGREQYVVDDVTLVPDLGQNAALNNDDLSPVTSTSPFDALAPLSQVAESSESSMPDTKKESLQPNCDVFVNATSGSDINTGLNSGESLKSLSKAVQVVTSNPRYRVVCAQPGVYTEALILNDLTGSAEKPFVFKSLGDEDVIVSGRERTLPLEMCVNGAQNISDGCLRTPLILVSKSSFIILENFHIRESSGVGIRVSASNNVTLIDTKISDNASFGMLINDVSPNVKVKNSQIYNNFLISPLRDFPQGAGVSVYSMNKEAIVKDFNLESSKIHNNYGDGVFIGPNTTGTTVSTSFIYNNTKANISLLNTQNANIKRNLVYCDAGLETLKLSLPSSVVSAQTTNLVLASSSLKFSDNLFSRNIIANNILHNCAANLLIDAKTGEFTQNTLINNTFASKNTEEQIIINATGSSLTSNSLINNLFLQNTYNTLPSYITALKDRNILNKNLLLTSQPTAFVADNMDFSIAHEVLDVLQSTQSASSSALSINQRAFMPSGKSKAVDAGDTNEMLPKDDYFGYTRTNAPDIGAVEVSSSQNVLGASISKDTPLATIPTSECTKYVNPGGDDTTGRSLITAHKTIQKGIQSLQAGDVLCINGGTYSEAVTIQKKFNGAQKVKIGAFSEGGSVILTAGPQKLPQESCASMPNLGSRASQTEHLMNSCRKKALLTVSDASNVDLVGLSIIESAASGVYIDESTDITFNSMNISKNGLYGAVIDESNNIVFSRSKVAENNSYRKNNSHINTAGVEISDDSEKVALRDTLVYSNFGSGLVSKGTDELDINDSAFVDNADTNVEIRQGSKFLVNRVLVSCSESGLNQLRSVLNNDSLDYALGISYFGTQKNNSSKSTLVNSIVQGCRSNLILNGDGDKYVSNVEVFNNSFINARTRTNAKDKSRNVLLLGTRFPGLKFKNNIVYQRDASIRTVVGYNSRYDFSANVLFPNTLRTLIAPAFIISDPKLNNPNEDINTTDLNVSIFMPKSGSPVINSADARFESDYIQVDYLKEPRANLDIGALEFREGDSDDNNGDNDEDDNDNDSGNQGGDDSGDNGGDDSGNGNDDGSTGDQGSDPTDPSGDDYCSYYWCDEDDSGSDGGYDYGYDYGSDYDYSGDDSTGYDPYADYYYEFDYGNDETAQFGFLEPSPTSEILKNGSFDLSKAQNGLPSNWFIRTGVDGAVKVNLISNELMPAEGNALEIQLKKLPAAGKVELFQGGLPLKAGQTYQLSFTAKSDYGSDVDVSLNNSTFPYEVLTSSLYGVDLKPDWNDFTGFIKIPETQKPNSNIRIVFSFEGAIDDTFFIDKISLVEVTPASMEEIPAQEPPVDENYPYNEMYPNQGNPDDPYFMSPQSPTSKLDTRMSYSKLVYRENF